jgi:hypothetical protein
MTADGSGISAHRCSGAAQCRALYVLAWKVEVSSSGVLKAGNLAMTGVERPNKDAEDYLID